MDRFFFENRLSALIDDELSPRERQEMAAAMSDPELRAIHDRFVQVVERLRTEGRLEAPPAWSEQMARRTATIRWGPRLPVVPATAGLVASALGLWWLLRSPDPEVTPAAIEADAVAAADAGDVPPAVEGQAVEEQAVEEQADNGAADQAASPDADPDVAPEEGAVIEEAPDEAAPDVSAPPTSAPAAPRPPTGRSVRSLTPRKPSTPPLERAPYYAEWESETNEPTAAEVQDWRYRVLAERESALSELQFLASALGSQLQTATGRPMAVYPMEAGEKKTVRIEVSAPLLPDLVRNLQALGTIEVISTPSDVPTEGSASVYIDLVQPG